MIAYKAAGLIALLALLVIGGCVTTPQARFYTLAIGVPAATDRPRSTLSLALGPIDLPQYLDRPQIVTRDGANRLQVDEFNRWGGSLDEEIHRVLAARLGERLGTQRIYAYPSRIVARTDYRIALDIRMFDGALDGEVHLDAAWSLIDDRTGSVVDVERALIRASTEQPGFAGYAGALSELLARLADDLAAAVARHADVAERR